MRWKPIPDPDPWKSPIRGLEFMREFAIGGAIRERQRAFAGKTLNEAPNDAEFARVVERGSRAGVAEFVKFQAEERTLMKRGIDLLERAIASAK